MLWEIIICLKFPFQWYFIGFELQGHGGTSLIAIPEPSSITEMEFVLRLILMMLPALTNLPLAYNIVARWSHFTLLLLLSTSYFYCLLPTSTVLAPSPTCPARPWLWNLFNLSLACMFALEGLLGPVLVHYYFGVVANWMELPPEGQVQPKGGLNDLNLGIKHIFLGYLR